MHEDSTKIALLALWWCVQHEWTRLATHARPVAFTLSQVFVSTSPFSQWPFPSRTSIIKSLKVARKIFPKNGGPFWAAALLTGSSPVRHFRAW